MAYADGRKESSLIFSATLTLPNKARFSEMEVSSSPGFDGFDVLIGMDIIELGDLLILGDSKETKAWFRFPSLDDGGLGLIHQG